MAQDNTPAIVMYKGPQEDGYSIPFDKGYYGEVKVAFVRRGLTDYEYNPTTYSVDGALYAWEISTGVYYYTKSESPAVDATVYNSGNQEISGVKVVSTQNASASFSDGKTGIRSNKKDIHSHALLFWTGEPLGDDDWICIVRETVKKQPYSYPNNQKHIEGALDNLSRQIQELKAQSDVSLKVDPTFVQDPAKMNPIDWLNTIVRSTDTTARGLRYRNFWLEYSTDDPNKAENDKSWTKLLNTTNVTTIRQLYNEETNEYYFQYSMDGGTSWLSVGLSKADIDKILDEANAYSDEQNALLENRINGKLTAVNAQIDANADAIQKTREDYIQADSEIHQILNNHAENLTTLHNDVDDLGDQVAGIEEKIPESASATNQLVTKEDLESIDLEGYATTEYVNAREQEIRDDVNQADSELQSQITAQASAITANTTSINGVKAVIPDGTSDINPLINKQQLLDEEMDIREDLNSGLSELQTQITAQATAIAGKQDQLTAGDNITIVDNVISATGGGGGDFLPLAGGTMTGNINFEYGSGEQFIGAATANGGILIAYRDLANSMLANYYFERFSFYGRRFYSDYKPNLGKDMFPWGRAYIQKINSGNGGEDIIIPTEGGTLARLEDLADIGGGGGITNVVHDTTLTGSGTDASPLGLAETIKDEIASKAPTATVEALTQVVNGIIGDYVKKTGDTMTGALNVPEITVQTAEGTFTVSVVAGVVTIATNNGLDFASPVKFDTAPTTDDNTTYANALDTSLVRKAQVATAIADAMANVDALPDQTGNTGKFLTTDGSTASWSDKPLVNTATGNSAIGIGSSLTVTQDKAVVLGTGNTVSPAGIAGKGSVVIGDNIRCGQYFSGVAIVPNAHDFTQQGAVAIGRSARVGGDSSIAIGEIARANAAYAIQLGGYNKTNSDANTFKVGNNNGNFEMMSADGTIPAERMSATAGTTGQVLTKTDTGMAWADVSGGDGDIDCGVMS